MKKFLLIVLCIYLMGCQKAVVSVVLNFDNVNEITVSDGNHLIHCVHDTNEDIKNLDNSNNNVTQVDINNILEFDIIDWKPFIDSFEELACIRKEKLKSRKWI